MSADGQQQQGYKVVLDRKCCIGAAKCAGIHPERWQLSDTDLKATIVGGVRQGDSEFYECEISEEEFAINLEAAQACPVNAIHVVKKATGERLI